jgi:hypothetical protein
MEEREKIGSLMQPCPSFPLCRKLCGILWSANKLNQVGDKVSDKVSEVVFGNSAVLSQRIGQKFSHMPWAHRREVRNLVAATGA